MDAVMKNICLWRPIHHVFFFLKKEALFILKEETKKSIQFPEMKY
jgi:hypothetical protein